jgi:hypothetical protein
MQSLNILAWASQTGTHEDLTRKLPSWVPDFRKLGSPGGILLSNASDSSVANFKFSEDHKELVARGVICDIVEWHEFLGNNVGSDSEEDLEDNSVENENNNLVANLCFQLLVALWQSKTFHPTGISWLQAYFRTLIEDQSGYGFGTLAFRSEYTKEMFFENTLGFISMMEDFLASLNASDEDSSTGIEDSLSQFRHPSVTRDGSKFQGRVGNFLNKRLNWVRNKPGDFLELPTVDDWIEDFCDTREPEFRLE